MADEADRDRRALLADRVALAARSPAVSATGESAGPPFFPGFRRLDIESEGVRFAGVTGGSGPPLLLLHGYPQTHIAWRKVAPRWRGTIASSSPTCRATGQAGLVA